MVVDLQALLQIAHLSFCNCHGWQFQLSGELACLTGFAHKSPSESILCYCIYCIISVWQHQHNESHCSNSQQLITV